MSCCSGHLPHPLAHVPGLTPTGSFVCPILPQIERRDYEGMLKTSQSQGRPRSSGAMAGADA